jgi:integrase
VRYSSSISRRKRRGRTEYIAVLSYYDESGERRQKRRTSFSSSEAKRIARELEDEYLEGGEVALYSDDLTFEDLANHCQQTKYCEAEYDESGNKLFGVRDTSVYQAHLKHFKKFFGKIRVRDIRVGNLRGYRNHRLRSKTKGGGNVNIGTVNREMNTLRAMLNEAKINDWIMVNPFTKARPGELINPADEQARETILTYEQEQRLLKECEGEDRRHLKALVIAGLDTGARKGELLRLTWPQVDFERNVIRALISYKGKNGAVLKRDAVMTARLRETLINLRQKRPVKAFRRLRNGDKPSELLVFGITHNVRRSWDGARKRSGLAHVRFHDLRHSAGTRLSEILPVVHVGKVLGHRNPKTTSRYINPDHEVLVKAASVLDQWQETQRLAAQKDEVLTPESEAVN